MTGRRFGIIGANAAASDYQFLLIANKYNFLDNQLVDLKTYKKKANLLNVSYITSLVNHYPEYGTTQLNVDLEKVVKNYKIHNIAYYLYPIILALFFAIYLFDVGMVFFQIHLGDGKIDSIGIEGIIDSMGIIVVIATIILVPMYYIFDGKNRDTLQNLLAEVYNFDQQQSQVYNNYQYN